MGVASLVFAVAFYLEAAVLGRIFYERDILTVWHAEISALRGAVAAGRWPVWNPWVGFGEPLWANPSMQVLYPATWLHAFFAPARVYSIQIVLQTALSAAGMFALARRFGLSVPAAATSAMAWSASGPFVSMASLWHHFSGAALIPWVLLAADRAAAGPRPALAWAAAVALQLLAGSADMAAVTHLMMAPLLVRRIFEQRTGTGAGAAVLRIAAAWALALSLAAAQWLPTLEIAQRSARRSLPDATRDAWSLHPVVAAQAVYPVLPSVLPLRADVRGDLYEGEHPFLLSVHLGLGLAMMALAGFATCPRGWRIALLLTMAVSATLALGRHAPLHAWAAAAIPGIGSLRYPVKFLMPAVAAFALLAGAGFDGLSSGLRWRWLVLAPAAMVWMAGALLFASLHLRSGWWAGWLEGGDAAGLLAAAAAPLALALAGALVTLCCLVAAAARGARPSVATLAAVAAVSQLVVATRPLNRTAPQEILDVVPPAVAAVSDGRQRRLFVYDYAESPGSAERHLGRRHGFQVAAPPGRDQMLAEMMAATLYMVPPIHARWQLAGSFDADLLKLHARPVAELLALRTAVEGTPVHGRVLALGAVGSVIALHRSGLEDLSHAAALPGLFPEPIHVFRVRNPVPRVYAVAGVWPAEGKSALDALVDPRFDPHRMLVLPHGPLRTAPAAFTAHVRTLEMHPDLWQVSATLSHPGYVVFVDAYDPGWKARIDGTPAPVLRANVAFRAVAVGAGTHAIELAYRPDGLRWGLALSGAASAGWVVAVAATFRRGRPGPSPA